LMNRPSAHKLLAVLVLAFLLAGCATPPKPLPVVLPPPNPVHPPAEAYTDAHLENLTFTARDGTQIHATAYLPTHPLAGHTQQEAFGTIVSFSPYYGGAFYHFDTDGWLSYE